MKHEDIKNILNNEKYINTNTTICGWIKSIRKSKNICFIELNDGTTLNNIQLVINDKELINNLTIGSSIAVNGTIIESQNKNQKVEINVDNIKLLGTCPQDYPIQRKKQSLENLREIPHLRVRTNTFNAVFRLRSILSKGIHDFFQENNFTYVNPPIITGSSCEGAGEMFRVTTLDIDRVSKEDYNPNLNSKDFFGKKVSLSVSGQLEAEAMINGFGKVYTFGPSFRAENSNTKKHAAEFWIVEPEVAFADLDDIIVDVEKLVKYLFKRILIEGKEEIKFFTKYYDNKLYDKLIQVLENEFLKIDYKEAIKILKESKENFEYPVYYGCELKTEHIKYLTDIKFKQPLFIMNSPKEQKPFYIKVNEDNKTVASADLYFPGIGDIIGASQKEEDFEKLKNRIKELDMTEEDYIWYLELRKYGSVPHSGFGLGIERLLMYTTGMDNIRDTIPFPRTKCKILKL